MAKKITPETDTKAAEAERQLQELNEIIAKVKAAQTKFATYTQQQVDDIFRAAAIAAHMPAGPPPMTIHSFLVAIFLL